MGETLLMIGGGGHKVGEMTDTEKSYFNLEEYAKTRFGVKEIK